METNGRVNITGFNPFMRFQMHDKIATQQQDTSFRNALTGNWQNSNLSSTFFSGENIRILQKKMSS